jgi:hypothetical protein
MAHQRISKQPEKQKPCHKGKDCEWIMKPEGCKYFHTEEEIQTKKKFEFDKQKQKDVFELSEEAYIEKYLEKNKEENKLEQYKKKQQEITYSTGQVHEEKYLTLATTKKTEEAYEQKKYDLKLEIVQIKEEKMYQTDRNYVYGLILLLEVHKGEIPTVISKIIWSFVTTYEGITLPRLPISNLWNDTSNGLIMTKSRLQCSCCRLTTTQYPAISTLIYNNCVDKDGCCICNKVTVAEKEPLITLIHKQTNICYQVHQSEQCLFAVGLSLHDAEKCGCQENGNKCGSCLRDYKYQLECVGKNYKGTKMCPMTKIFRFVTPHSIDNQIRCIDIEKKKHGKSDEVPKKHEDWYHIRDRQRFDDIQRHLPMFKKNENPDYDDEIKREKRCMICKYSRVEFQCDGMELCAYVKCHWACGITVRQLDCAND